MKMNVCVLHMFVEHVVRDKVEAVYARSDLFERRRQLMNEWAVSLNGAAAQAVPCRG